MDKKGISAITGIIVAMVILGAIGIGFYINYQNQKSVTANVISDLERQLEEQGSLTAEQERKLEELAQVTCKEVQIPYDAQESYTEQEPYLDEKCTTTNLVYSADYSECSFGGWFSDPRVIVAVNNLDSSKGGSFIFWVGFNLKDGNKVGQEVTQYIYPLSSEQFQYTAGIDSDNIDSCQYIPKNIPTKTNCETITSYQPVIKYRTVTKYRTETICE